MANKFQFDAEILAQAVAIDKSVAASAKNLSVGLNADIGKTSGIATALVSDVKLSSSLLHYDNIYKPPMKAVFEAAAETGDATSIEHVDSVGSVLSQFNASLLSIQADLGTADDQSDTSLQARTQAFFERYADDPDVMALRKLEGEGGRLRTFQAIFNERSQTDEKVKDDSSRLFQSGRLLLRESQHINALHNKLSLLQRSVMKRLVHLREQKQQLATEIIDARRQLDALNRTRVEDAGDYAMAQRLLIEDWQSVETRFLARRKVLESYSGLYYVRVREAAIGYDLPALETLRHLAPDDVVPGCGDVDIELPDELAPFLDTVLDIPLADWRLLAGDAHGLPGKVRHEVLLRQRQQRLQIKTTTAYQPPTALQGLYKANTQLLATFANRPLIAAPSLQQQLSVLHRVLSLEDVLNGARTLLTAKAERLNRQLHQAAQCLLASLQAMPPSLRFRWAQRVEDGQLPLSSPVNWPGLADSQAVATVDARTLTELVDWLYRQLSDDADDSSRTAIDHVIGACILVSALEDPDQILYGAPQTLPLTLRPGESMRLTLNREAAPGTRLQLLDTNRQVVGLLRVDDHDAQGAVATIMHLYDSVSSQGRFSVTGSSKTRRVGA